MRKIIGVILMTVMLLLAAAGSLQARDLYVNPKSGSDKANGLTPTVRRGSGPLKTIACALRLAGPGDTVHLAKTTYKNNMEYVGFYNKSGESGKPIVLDGHGAVIDGSVPLDPRDWQEVSPGLYRNASLFKDALHSYEDWVVLFCFVFAGKLNRMGHSQKAPDVPYKKPSELRPGEWTYQKEDGHAFYLQIDPARTLADYHIEVPWVVTGVQLEGDCRHVVVKNLTVTHVINDGFATTNRGPGTRICDAVFENIKAIDCCDDGFSAHGDSEVRIDGFLSDGNSTGICSQGDSVDNHVTTVRGHIFDV